MALDRKIAYVDLTRGQIETASIPLEMREEYIGGRGLGAYLLYNHLRAGVAPFSPDNVVVVSAGLLGGTLASASARTQVMSKSPLTGYLGSTNVGGFFAPELSWSGFHHIVIEGKSPKPSYLFIHDGRLEIRDGSSIWGKTVQDAQETLTGQLQDEDIQTLCIGPAGEKLVRFANVVIRHQNAGGRTGIGAVLGSKNLKAIVARGTRGIEVEFPKEALDYDREVVRRICASEFGRMMQRRGTTFLYGIADSAGSVRTHNLQSDRLADSQRTQWENIGRHSLRMQGCFGCQLHCRHRYLIEEGPYAGVYVQGPECGSHVAWAAEVGCGNMNTILVGSHLADSYGFDMLEAGRLISWAMELYGKGILTDQATAGLKLGFGNDESVIEMIHRIGRREGLGDLLAEGGLRASQKIGEGSDSYLIQAKGLSSLCPDGRPTRGQAVGIAAATDGSDRLLSGPALNLNLLPESLLGTIYDRPHAHDDTLPPDRRDHEEKPWQVFRHELCHMAADMIGMCRFHTVSFSPDMPGFEEFSRMIYLNTGLQLSAEEIWECAHRAHSLERLFNRREGSTEEDDSPVDLRPDEPTSTGPDVGRSKSLDRQTFEAMLGEYYRIHEWDENGAPAPESLRRLGLDKEPSHRL